jgi:pimeloyl-ACP methyl ester carboxylesterase
LAKFVLVHGSFHGPWCWSRLIPLFVEQGHSVVTADLGNAANGQGLPEYAALVADAVVQAGDSVILVGHSMGGLVISQAAEMLGPQLLALVYVCGLMLRDQETLNGFLRTHAGLGVADRVLENMVVSADRKLASFPQAIAPSVFYNRCAPADADWAAAQLRPQPTAVYITPLHLTAENFGAVPRYYVQCTDDQAVSIAYQRQMLVNSPCRKTYCLETDHSPFLSAPLELFSCLQDVAAITEPGRV